MIQYDSFMPKGLPFSRIAITLPAEDLALSPLERIRAAEERVHIVGPRRAAAEEPLSVTRRCSDVSG